MSDIDIRVTGRAGRVTLTRAKALNALTYEMCRAIDQALRDWAEDDAVACVVIDAEGARAFCAGGDIAEMYATGTAGDYEYGRRFWRDEYRMNARIFHYPKPVVSFLHGFTMGGGVGLGCHGSHRIVGETSQVAMPECGIGLVPDVGGSFMLALAPGRLGEYLGATGARMGPGDAIFAGFADTYIPQEHWPKLITALEETGDTELLAQHSTIPPEGALIAQMDAISVLFSGERLSDILNLLKADETEFATQALRLMERNAPLAMACAIEMVHRLRGSSLTLEKALDMEYRFTFRAAEHGDFLEGIRAAIIDKDRNPAWRYADGVVPQSAVSQMLLPLGADGLNLQREA